MKKAMLFTLVFCMFASGCQASMRNEPYTDINSNSGQCSEEEHIHECLPATCTTPQTCKKCGQTLGPELGHEYMPATCITPQKCSRCGIEQGEALGHDYSPATCESPMKCIRCGATDGNPLGHDYSIVGEYGVRTCSVCGAVDPDSKPVRLDEIFLVDSNFYSYESGAFTDSFGNTYDGVHLYTDLYQYHNKNYPHSSFSLDGQYAKFYGKIVASEKTRAKWSYCIYVYADGELVYSKTGIQKTTGAIPFEIDVSGCVLLEIYGNVESTMGDYDMEIGIVDAILQK